METLAYVPFQRYSAQWQACVHSMYINRHLWEVLTYTWWSYLHVSVLLLFPSNQRAWRLFQFTIIFVLLVLFERGLCMSSKLLCVSFRLFQFNIILVLLCPLWNRASVCHLGALLSSRIYSRVRWSSCFSLPSCWSYRWKDTMLSFK